MEFWQILRYIIIAVFLAGIVISVIIRFIIYWMDKKNGLRFPSRTRIYCLYNNNSGPVYGRITSRVRRKKGERCVEYTLCPSMLKKFEKGKKFRIKVKICSQNKLEILDMPRPAACKLLLIGDREYSGGTMVMRMDEEIIVIVDTSKAVIKLEY